MTLTGNPFSIGLIGLSEVIPAVGCALYAGYFIDMNEKRRLLLFCNLAYILLLGALLIPAWFQASFGVSNTGVVYFIYFIVFLTGIVRSFLGPIVPTMIPKIVSKGFLSKAIAVNQTVFLSSSVLGHALGGFLVSWIAIKGTLLAIVFSLLTSLFFYSFVKSQPSEVKDKVKVLFGGAVALVPVFARDILQVGAVGYGFLNAAADIGAAITILVLTFLPLGRNQGKILIASAFGFGLCIMLFGMSEYFILSFIALMFSGILDGVSVVVRGTIVQLKTPNCMRGRVMSVNSMFVMSSNELGQFESGLTARLFGVANAVIIGGGITMFIAILVGFSFSELRKMEYLV